MASDGTAPASPVRAVVEVIAHALVDTPDAVKVTESERRGMTIVALTTALCVFVFWTHRENIRRLARGEEKPIVGGGGAR